MSESTKVESQEPVSLRDLIQRKAEDCEFRAAFLTAEEKADIALTLADIVEQQSVALQMARRMETSPTQVSRLLDPGRSGSATISSLCKFARATGLRLKVLLESEFERSVRERVMERAICGDLAPSALQLDSRVVQFLLPTHRPSRGESERVTWEQKSARPGGRAGRVQQALAEVEFEMHESLPGRPV